MQDISTYDIGKWMRAADYLASLFSTCGRKTYAAIILDSSGNMYSFGYNGQLPNKALCIEGGCPRMLSNSEPGSDYSNCVAPHAEVMAIINSGGIKYNSTIVVNGPPCEACGRVISQSGLSRVIYKPDNDYRRWTDIKAQMELHGVRVLGYVLASAEKKASPAGADDVFIHEKIHK